MYYIIYPLLWLVSLLPFWVLYGISDFLSFFVYNIIGYRKDTVLHNLKIAFPEKTEEERKKIAKRFYRNMVDTFLESIKFITITEKTILKRSSSNFELLEELLKKGKNIHVMAGHQFNWEYANLLFANQLSTPFVGVYMPISNKALDKIFYNFRKKYGTILISASDFKNKMHSVFDKQYMLALAADQNPGDPTNGYWMQFFNRATPFVTGPAKGAIRNNAAVVMVAFEKPKRGYYHFNCSIIKEDVTNVTPQQLTVLYKNVLEEVIKKDPTNYLWSHRRWKYDYNESYGTLIS